MAQKRKKTLNLEFIKAFAFLILLSGLVLASLIYIIQPKLNQVGQSLQSSKENEEKLSMLTQKLSLLKGLDESKLKARSELVLKALPEGKEPMRGMMVFKKLAQDSQVELSGVEVKPGKIAADSAVKKKKGQVPSLTYSLKLTGELHRLVEFVGRLEKALPLIRLERASFKPERNSQNYSVSAQVYFFYSSLPDTLGKTDFPIALLTEKEIGFYEWLAEFEEVVLPEPVIMPETSVKTNPFI